MLPVKQLFRKSASEIDEPGTATLRMTLYMQEQILVVDDDSTVRAVVCETLEWAGYRVEAARDGAEALHKLDNRLPDLILLDVMMPRMDGYEFMTHLEHRGLRSAVPIVVFSASGRAKEFAREMGADAYIGKPFEIDDLIEKIAQLLA